VSNKPIICESAALPPKNKGGFLVWLAEMLFDYEHKHHFKRFLSQGGIEGLLNESGLSTRIEYLQVFWHRTLELAVVCKTEESIRIINKKCV